MDNDRLNILARVLEESKKYVEMGQEIPIDFQKIMFPSGRKECELVYGGKESYEQILTKVIAVPLQEEKKFPTSSKIDDEKWTNKLIFGDNLQTLKTLIEMKKRGLLINSDGTHGVKLIYIDPPFSTRRDFKASGESQKAYSDKLAGADFLEWLRKRIVLLRELLSDDGSIYVHLDNKKVAYVKVLMDEIFGENNFRSSITWDTSIPYVAGNKWLSNNWIYSQATILYYTKSKTNFVFNKEFDNVKQPSGDISKKPIKDVWCDIKNFAGFLGARDYKTGYPTQKPEALLKRIINASSNEGDIVLDCFAGSGTTAIVSEKLNRKWIAVDVGKLSIYTIQKRLLSLEQDKISPFTLYSAGLYDESKLNAFDEENWKIFAMQLWGCNIASTKIKNFEFDGNRYGSLVKVYSPLELKKINAKISIETLQSISSRVGESAGKNIVIIAPKGQFTFAEDEIEINNIIFTILRIPYSMLAKYTEEFTAPLQPKNALSVNEAVESVGFDFIQPPTVEFEITDNYLIIKNFKSNSRIKGEESSTISMVLIDYNYDGKTFDLDEVLFESDFKEQKAKFYSSKIKKQAMLIFVDDSGNEKKVIVNE
jgi:site-specific DNA-methyltransferase (adenine-specific)/adenine-specific DNA-methyltransferase